MFHGWTYNILGTFDGIKVINSLKKEVEKDKIVIEVGG